MPAVGAALALWSVATLAGLYSMGTSLTAASNRLPPSLLAPGTIALADPRRALASSWALSLPADARHRQALLGRCDAACLRQASNFSHDGKMARLRPAARPDSVAPRTAAPETVARTAPADRFDSVVASAKLSPQKLADAFARAQDKPVLLASLPADARFAEPVRLPDQQGPASVRFGPPVAEIERSSRLALALANAMPEVDMLSPPPSVALAAPDGLQEPQGTEVLLASLPPQDEMPDTIPLPTGRPRALIEQPDQSPKAQASRADAPRIEAPQEQAPKASASKTGKAQSAKAADVLSGKLPALSPRSSEHAAVPALPGVQASQAKPAKDAEMLAYAKPDMPERGAGGVFGNLFSNRPSVGNGVAVYDIAARTVYMPDGSKLEAHSGLGSMVDQPRFVNKKNVGPTPPDTYNLSMRESRFHGVEAIRLTPTSGKNKYGRDGLLAHTYMLRGGRAESNGCVVFKDYARFLAAYKKGKIKRLVVVPRMSKPLTQVAQEGRQG
ncbi:tlde1 domain-containing protein [Mesorhizobium sp.]|uniref:tlde1 domain-containing protein n=1 Tax=Mesorhizobium sp. TaxID=1871066 RepID=UPI0025BFD7B6|nr:tlde1 domain-containing protein [Mesorhizobium sp.]